MMVFSCPAESVRVILRRPVDGPSRVCSGAHVTGCSLSLTWPVRSMDMVLLMAVHGLNVDTPLAMKHGSEISRQTWFNRG